MERKKIAGIVLIVLGIIVLIVFLAADLFGIGVSPGFGYKQLAGAVVGIVVALVGLALTLRK